TRLELADLRCEQLRGHLHVFWNVAGVIDDCVPTAAAPAIELRLAITQQRLDTCDAISGRLAAVEMRHSPAIFSSSRRVLTTHLALQPAATGVDCAAPSVARVGRKRCAVSYVEPRRMARQRRVLRPVGREITMMASSARRGFVLLACGLAAST